MMIWDSVSKVATFDCHYPCSQTLLSLKIIVGLGARLSPPELFVILLFPHCRSV